MNNFIQPGDTITLVAPYTLTSGKGGLVGDTFGVAADDVTSGANGEFVTEGVFSLDKVSAQAWTQGQVIYWDNSAKLCTTVAFANTRIGVARVLAANPSSVGTVRLNGAYDKAGVQSNLATLNTYAADIGTAGSTFVLCPYAGTIVGLEAVNHVANAGTKTVLTAKLATVAVTAPAWEVAVTAAAGTGVSVVPTAANTVAAGDVIEVAYDGGSSNVTPATFSIVINRTK